VEIVFTAYSGYISMFGIDFSVISQKQLPIIVYIHSTTVSDDTQVVNRLCCLNSWS